MSVVAIAEKFGVKRKTVYRYVAMMDCIPEALVYFDSGLLKIECAELLRTLSEEDQKNVLYHIDETGQKMSLPKLNAFLAGNEVETETKKRFYRNTMYNKIDEQFDLDKEKWSEKDLDVLVLSLLADYFEKSNGEG